MRVENWGLIDYEVSNLWQLQRLEAIAVGHAPNALIFCHHPPVVTMGRGTRNSDITTWSGATVHVSRGGRATYHGPNQQVIYPIVNIGEHRDLRYFLRQLEDSVIQTLSAFGVQARTRQDQLRDSDGAKLETTGVWVGDQKVAALGIAIKKWVTYHGVAINLYEDKLAFKGIRPCGFSPDQVTSVEAILGEKIDRVAFQTVAETKFRAGLERYIKGETDERESGLLA